MVRRAVALRAVAVSALLVGSAACEDGGEGLASAQAPRRDAGSRDAPRPPDPPPALGPRAEVTLIVLGEFPEEMREAVAAGLRDELQVDVVDGGRAPLPQRAWYPPRRRYRAEKILDYLHARMQTAPRGARVLALTSVDISTTKPPHRDWGVLGLGDLGGSACVISTFRMRRSARDADHLRFRIVSTAVHEVGHTLGLEHCTEPRCVMNDAEGRIATIDNSTGRLGPECRAEVDRESPRRSAQIE